MPRPFTFPVNHSLIDDNAPCLIERPDNFKQSFEVLKRFRLFEEMINKNKEEKNKLESFIFQARELPSNEGLKLYTQESEVEALKILAEEMDDWLYSAEAKDANFTVFSQKSSNFSKTFDAIRNRREEHGKRDQAVSDAYKQLDSIQNTIQDMNETRPWVPAAERNKSLEIVQSVRDWLNASLEEQLNLTLSEEPAFRVRDIKKKLVQAQEEVYRLRAILKEEDAKGTKGKRKPKSNDGSGFKFKLRDLIKVASTLT